MPFSGGRDGEHSAPSAVERAAAVGGDQVRGTEGGEAGEEGMLEFMSEGRGILCVHVCTCVYMCVLCC